MLRYNLLASNSVYCSISHQEKFLIKYFNIFNDIFYKISRVKNGDNHIKDCLKSEVCISGMRNKYI